MAWNKLTNEQQVIDLRKASFGRPQLIFKHSTRCSISSMALHRFEGSDILESDDIDCWYLDLLQFRPISDQIESKTGVKHQSPQVIVLLNDAVIYDASHGMINGQEILKQLKKS